MSRWTNKNRLHGFAFPLDSLAKEKENTNRPVAARSAGTVGKWGTTSFTSIRTPSYGYVAYSNQDTINQPNTSPLSGDGSLTPHTYSAPDAPKPRKFFKSRNAVAVVEPALFQVSPNAHQSAATAAASSINTSPFGGSASYASTTTTTTTEPQNAPKIRLKINKKQLLLKSSTAGAALAAPHLLPPAASKPAKLPKPAKVKKPPKPVKEKPVKVAKPVPEPTRKLSRQRKAVNYSENRSRSPTPRREMETECEVAPDANTSEPMEASSFTASEEAESRGQRSPSAVPSVSEEDTTTMADSSAEIAEEDHPPIVLRISKGTAKLVRTDSEETNVQQPDPDPPQAIATTAELLAVLTDDLSNPIPEPPQIVAQPPRAITPEPIADHVLRPPSPSIPQQPAPAQTAASHRPHSIKIKIKTNFAHMICEPFVVDPPQLPLESTSTPLAEPIAPPPPHPPVSAPSKRTTRNKAAAVAQPPPIIPPLTVKLPTSPDKMEIPVEEPEECEVTKPAATTAPRRTGRRAVAAISPSSTPVAVPAVKSTRQSRKTASAAQLPDPVPVPMETEPSDVRSPTIAKSYNRKRRLVEGGVVEKPPPTTPEPIEHPDPTNNVSAESILVDVDLHSAENNNCVVDLSVHNTAKATNTTDEHQEPSVKLVISKKKGSIFKSRATDAAASGTAAETNKAKRRQLYRHKWDHDTETTSEKGDTAQAGAAAATAKPTDTFEGAFDEEDDTDYPSGVLSKVTRTRPQTGGDFRLDHHDDDFGDNDSGIGAHRQITSVRCDSKAKNFYTVIRNVKKAHQIQEIGEFQEMDDDVDYILDALQSHNPMATRCLSAIQLASKCMTPAFRMHVRAHGTITRFFKALDDAKNNQSLGLCTATVMFVLNQDNLNMDLDRDSLSLMLNLLESDASHQNALEDCGLTNEQLNRNREKVTEICTEIKAQGRAIHLNLDNITVGTLAMETLLSLTSKRAGEWFKEELRTLGGLEKIINTICECCEQIAGSDYVDEWEGPLLEKLRKIERCLRVLENVTTQNEENQTYILNYRSGLAVDSLVRFYRLCTMQIGMHPTDAATPKDSPGVVLREALIPTLKVLINLTHPFCEMAFGSAQIGANRDVYETSLRLLFQVIHYVPEQSVFELSILVLLLLINLTTYTTANRKIVLEAKTPEGVDREFDPSSAITALIHYFNKHEALAQQVEENTDAILDNKSKSKRNAKSQEEVDETVTKLIQRAGTHMEHTLLASYVSLLIGYLIMDSAANQSRVRKLVRNGSFTAMVQVLDKYYTFMNLTASSEAATVTHIKQTKRIMEYFQKCDTHSTNETASDDEDDFEPPPVLRRSDAPQHQYRSMRNNNASTSASASASSSYNSYSTASRSGR